MVETNFAGFGKVLMAQRTEGRTADEEWKGWFSASTLAVNTDHV
jgi:hypothetical protein